MAHVADLSRRLMEEILEKYDSRVDSTRFQKPSRTLWFFTQIYASGGNVACYEVHERFLQQLCVLANCGFEEAAGFDHYDDKYYDGIVGEIWSRFGKMLIRWVRAQPDHYDEPLTYGCFQVPEWFVKAARSKSLQGFYS